ncbi:MAG: hypothetical protein ACJ8BW_31920 [Ktedonobacteraceae bacterium]
MKKLLLVIPIVAAIALFAAAHTHKPTTVTLTAGRDLSCITTSVNWNSGQKDEISFMSGKFWNGDIDMWHYRRRSRELTQQFVNELAALLNRTIG